MGVGLNFKKTLLLLIKEEYLNLMLAESLQCGHQIKIDTEDDECEHVLEILRGISNGNIKSPHMTKYKAKYILKIFNYYYGTEK